MVHSLSEVLMSNGVDNLMWVVKRGRLNNSGFMHGCGGGDMMDVRIISAGVGSAVRAVVIAVVLITLAFG